MTHHTTKRGLRLPVRSFSMPTGAPALAGVVRINRNHTHAHALCLVGNELAQLAETPIAVSRSLVCVPNLYPFAHALQLRQGNPASGAFRSPNQPLADLVIDVFLKPLLAAAQLLQATFGRLGFHFLERGFATGMPAADAFSLIARLGHAVRVGRKVHDPQIDTEKASRLIGRGIGLGLGDVQIPDVFPPDKLRAADLPAPIIKRSALEVAQLHLPNHAPAHGVQADLIEAHQPVRSHIVTDRTIVAEGRTGLRDTRARLPIRFLRGCAHGANRLSRFISGAARQLRAQAIVGTSRAVDDRVQLVFICDLLFPRDRGAIGSGLIECNLSRTQCRITRAIKRQFTAYGSCGNGITHKESTPPVERLCKHWAKAAKAGCFLPPLKLVGLHT